MATSMSPPLLRQRCWNHAEREAAARCPGCARFFCRECVTEHGGRVICAACLRELLAAAALQPVRGGRFWRGAWTGTLHGAQLILSLLVAWFFFHLVGQMLISAPTEFHEGSLWQKAAFGGDD